MTLLRARSTIDRTPERVHRDEWRTTYYTLQPLDVLDYIDGAWDFLRILRRA